MVLVSPILYGEEPYNLTVHRSLISRKEGKKPDERKMPGDRKSLDRPHLPVRGRGLGDGGVRAPARGGGAGPRGGGGAWGVTVLQRPEDAGRRIALT
ncbi:MAG: hypothetical protein ACP5PX_08180, partial [Candidatus Hadarchaeum sp.]